MKLLLTFFILLCFSLPSFGGKLLILTEPTAVDHLGPLLSEFVYYVQKKETNFLDGVIIREHTRWNRDFTTNDWTLLNKMSNDVVYFQPTAVLIIGSLPYLVTGAHNLDGHELRCIATDVWLGCTNITFTDTTDWGMTGYNATTAPLNKNIPGDGRPDQTLGTKARWVGRIDAAGMGTNTIDKFGAGCLNGLDISPGINEGLALRAYFTNNIAYRNGTWTTTATGRMSGTLWTISGTACFNRVTNFNSSVTWTYSVPDLGGGTPRYNYDDNAGSEADKLYDGDCIPMKALVSIVYRSYSMELIPYWGAIPFRRLFPGRQTEPYSLVYLWSASGGTTSAFWLSSTTDTMVAHMIDKSVTEYGSNTWPFYANFHGDITLPLVAQTSRAGITRAETLQIVP